MDGSLSNDLVGRVDGAHVYCDLTVKDKLLEIRYDGEKSSILWALDEILSAGIRAILGIGNEISRKKRIHHEPTI
jgi:hypothetical protein